MVVDDATKELFTVREGILSGFKLFENRTLVDGGLVPSPYAGVGAAVRTGHHNKVEVDGWEAPSVFPVELHQTFQGSELPIANELCQKSYGHRRYRRRQSQLPRRSRHSLNFEKKYIIPRTISTNLLNLAHAVQSRKLFSSITIDYAKRS